MNLTMVYSYRSSYIYLPVALVDFQVEVLPSRLYHVCQGEYVLLNDIDFEWGERKICRDCVDEVGGGRKLDKLKKVGDITVYKTVEL